MGVITAEALYPAAYTTHTQSISDLAAMRPDNIVRQPSAMIFNATMILAGLAIAAAAYLLHRAGNPKGATIAVAVLGLGMVGVGCFPGNHLAPHTLFSMTAFIAGGVGAILTAKLHTGPLRILHAALGIISLTALAVAVFLLQWAPVERLGEGGLERWVVYPVVLWVITLGASLAANRATPNPVDGGVVPAAAKAGHADASVTLGRMRLGPDRCDALHPTARDELPTAHRARRPTLAPQWSAGVLVEPCAACVESLVEVGQVVIRERAD